ncbi:receptor-type tyrosine-protein phosphatase H isoform X2 [Boleophthalmus pectinirostris]|uniref:receptor-type tyrosine-protein phosphatase H isoform X2 n=1 Tax=Boleophthalmus pectinirostris TaxID=150288 RepID=UPI00242E4CD1|nr:receptor-type tyrosine-protein phosphatase H isoform X2 [Boleophthalmus pectinirostris]
MDFFTFRFSAYDLLLVFCLCPFWRATDCTTVTATTETTVTNPPTTALSSPADVNNVTVVHQTENSVTIKFDKVNGINEYNLTYINDTFQSKIITWDNDNPAVYTVEYLMPAQKYNMTLYSQQGGFQSSGYPFNAKTAPENVVDFRPVNQNESSITLIWTKTSGDPLFIFYFNGTEENISDEPKVVTDLKSGTEYSFTLYSVFEDIRSTGANLTASTAPKNVADFRQVNQNESSITLNWTKTSDDSQLIFNFNGTEKNITDEQKVVTDLKSGTEYSFTLYSVFNDIRSTGANLTASTAPSKVNGFDRVSENETSITLKWENDPKINYILMKFNETEKNFTALGFENITEYTVTSLNDTTIYNFTLFTVFRNILGDGVTISAATRPRDATAFKVQNRTNSSITLEWKKVGDIQDYEIDYDSKRESVNPSSGNVETYIAKNLQSGTIYRFRLYTKLANISSNGVLLEAPTAPSPVSSVKAVQRTLNTITLKLESVKENWSCLVDSDGTAGCSNTSDGNSVYCTVKSLKAGTLYSFSIKTVFEKIESTPIQYNTVTVIDCSVVDWQVKGTSIVGLVEGEFTNATVSNGSLHLNSGSNKQIEFTGLYPGANYTMKLMYEELEQCNYIFNTIPPRLTAKCKNWNAGYSVYIEWDSPSGVWDSVEIIVSNNVHNVKENKSYAVIKNVQPAKKYQVNISSISGRQRSSPFIFTCATDARGVIAGAFFGVFIFVVLVCVVAFIMLRRPDIFSHKKLSNGGAKTIVKKRIPLEKFPGHFNELSADENKGFSLDYEELASVGTEQTQNAATTPENKPKNRFINVLPYDRSRVKLTSSPQSDYINANYMPGYNSDREFIAAQGPLPSTVNDFWRMIWEQKVRGIIMVTNCTEGGRVKCEQYWPDSNPRQCGDFEVFTTSEKKLPDWTLREFTVKHSRTLEERTVKHFHFTAWPDHGVPQGTQVLIEFRELVRQHMQTEAAGTPTVVHCSAGVGRTGTIIALDVLLQQMQKEKAVDIYGFVHKMRLNRPHMVQTESQYVFLHQCILDCLMKNEKHDENIYENELIYANATALREFQNNMNKS